MRDQWLLFLEPVEGIEVQHDEAVEVGVGEAKPCSDPIPAAGADGKRMTVDGMESERGSRVENGWPAGRDHDARRGVLLVPGASTRSA